MQEQVLVTDKKYEGKYVALASFMDNTVLAWGDDPEEILKPAHAAGARDPVIVYIPQSGITCIY
jgi:hypothetical protein